MVKKSKIKVALVRPPLAGHKNRGTGVYTENLYQSLVKNGTIDVEMVNNDEKMERFDLVHYPYFDPFFLTIPLLRHKPSVITVHDLIPIKLPQHFPKGIKGKIKWAIQRKVLASANGILTDSNASKKDIISLAGVGSGKIEVVYLGFDGRFMKVNDKESVEKTNNKFHLPEKFILYVGDVNANKNVLGLISAFNLFQKQMANIHLVLCGKGFGEKSVQLEEIKKKIAENNLKNKIVIIGLIGSFDLVNLYNLAALYVQPSIAEGFGLPILEAMACGCPVVSSNLSSLPEVCGNAALLVDPRKTKDLSSALKKIIIEDTYRIKLIKKGFENIKRFNWKKCAEDTVKVYKKYI